MLIISFQNYPAFHLLKISLKTTYSVSQLFYLSRREPHKKTGDVIYNA